MDTNFLFDTGILLARLQQKAQKPTDKDHRLAEYRGIWLCDNCGKELAYPGEQYQLCGACEEIDNASPQFCVVCRVEPIDPDHAPTCGSHFCREGWEQEQRR